MKGYCFEVEFFADDVTIEELEEAITERLRSLDLPNGDSLYIDPKVMFTHESSE